MKYQLSIIENPSGTFGFVGSVPYMLGWTSKTGVKITAEYVERQLMLPSSYRDIKSRSFKTFEEAQNAAELFGFKVSK